MTTKLIIKNSSKEIGSLLELNFDYRTSNIINDMKMDLDAKDTDIPIPIIYDSKISNQFFHYLNNQDTHNYNIPQLVKLINFAIYLHDNDSLVSILKSVIEIMNHEMTKIAGNNKINTTLSWHTSMNLSNYFNTIFKLVKYYDNTGDCISTMLLLDEKLLQSVLVCCYNLYEGKIPKNLGSDLVNHGILEFPEIRDLYVFLVMIQSGINEKGFNKLVENTIQEENYYELLHSICVENNDDKRNAWKFTKLALSSFEFIKNVTRGIIFFTSYLPDNKLVTDITSKDLLNINKRFFQQNQNLADDNLVKLTSLLQSLTLENTNNNNNLTNLTNLTKLTFLLQSFNFEKNSFDEIRYFLIFCGILRIFKKISLQEYINLLICPDMIKHLHNMTTERNLTRSLFLEILRYECKNSSGWELLFYIFSLYC